jgi:chromosome segregation ATPase
VEYGTEPVPDTIPVVNPEWRKLDSQIRSKTGQRYRLTAQFGALALSEEPNDSELHEYQQQKGQLHEEIQHLDREIDTLKQQRKETVHHIPVKSLPEQDRFIRLRTERKHFVDTIKMIGYRAETSLASLLREHLARSDDARALLRQVFNNEVDLVPDSTSNTLTVRLHHLTEAAHDQAIDAALRRIQ